MFAPAAAFALLGACKAAPDTIPAPRIFAAFDRASRLRSDIAGLRTLPPLPTLLTAGRRATACPRKTGPAMGASWSAIALVDARRRTAIGRIDILASSLFRAEEIEEIFAIKISTQSF